MNLECGICFEQVEKKNMDKCLQLECGHFFDNKCIRPWCNTCIDNDSVPNCPICRETIGNEYLDILGIDFYKQTNNIVDYHRTIQLFNHIIENKIYKDQSKLFELVQQNPEQIPSLILMLKGYLSINKIRIDLSNLRNFIR
jgi:hypothetical protein